MFFIFELIPKPSFNLNIRIIQDCFYNQKFDLSLNTGLREANFEFWDRLVIKKISKNIEFKEWILVC